MEENFSKIITNDYDRVKINKNIHFRIFNSVYVTQWYKEIDDRIIIPISNHCENWCIEYNDSTIFFDQYKPFIIEQGVLHRIKFDSKNSFSLLKLLVIKNYNENFYDYIKEQIINLK